jgi:hypothetical protein
MLKITWFGRWARSRSSLRFEQNLALGFTDEELEFIINYGIKYRMDQDDGEQEA